MLKFIESLSIYLVVQNSLIKSLDVIIGYGHGIMSHKDTTLSAFFECF
jgi:hypothetical protein